MHRLLLAGCLASFAASFPAASTACGDVKFSEHLIRGKYGYAYGISAADLDGDGDVDLISSDTTDDKTPRKDNGTLLWFENDGKGVFSQHVIAKQESGWFERNAVGDFDGDGRIDVAVVLNREGSLVWFRNPERPTKDPWQRRTIVKGRLPGAYDVAIGDLDGDGRLDVAASSWIRGKRFEWFRNPGKGKFEKDWSSQVIEGDLLETRTIVIADFNGDARLDVLGTASAASLVAWYENTGKADGALQWKKRVIDDKSLAPIHGHASDMDGDGDLDVVMACGMRDAIAPGDQHQVVWYENAGTPGRGLHWKKHVVGSLPGAFEAIAGDLDGDGRLDIIATAWGPAGRLAWFQHPGAGGARWSMRVLKSDWANANQVIAVDINNDGRLDLAATAERGANEFRWWRNDKAAAKNE